MTSVLVALLVLAAPAPAPRAAGDAEALRILVVAPGAAADRTEELYAGLRAAGLLAVELDERAGVDRPAPAVTTAGTRDEVRARVTEARARFRDLDFDGATSSLDEAFDELLRLDRPEDSLADVADALLLRAHIALQREDVGRAKDALTLLARLEPERESLNAGLYPPSLVDAYAAARAEVPQAPTSTLIVRPRVAGFAPAEIVVDGRPASGAALGVALGEGDHLVTARSAGAVTFSRLVRVEPGAPVVLEPFLAPAGAVERRAALVEQAATAGDDVARAPLLAELASSCAARAVLWVDATHAALFVPGRGVDALQVAPTAPGLDVGRAALAALQAPARRDAGLPPVDEPSWITAAAWAGGSAAALVVVGGAIAAAVWALLPASPPDPPPRPVPVSCCVD